MSKHIDIPERKLSFPKQRGIQDQIETENAYMESIRVKADAEFEKTANSTTFIDTIAEGLATGNKIDFLTRKSNYIR